MCAEELPLRSSQHIYITAERFKSVNGSKESVGLLSLSAAEVTSLFVPPKPAFLTKVQQYSPITVVLIIQREQKNQFLGGR